MKKNVIFVWIPKNAGTTIYTAMNEIIPTKKITFDNPERNKELLEKVESGWITTGHMSFKKILDENLLDEKYLSNSFIFCFMRNPYDRAMSAANHLGLNIHELTEHIQKDNITPLGLYNQAGLSQARPQTEWMFDGDELLVDYIGAVETLQEDWDEICNLLGVPQTNLPHKNKKSHPSFFDVASEKETEIIQEFYKEDFQKLTYHE